jgi:hypothetical protein
VSSQSITLHPKVSKDWTPKKRFSPKIQNPSKSYVRHFGFLDEVPFQDNCFTKNIT